MGKRTALLVLFIVVIMITTGCTSSQSGIPTTSNDQKSVAVTSNLGDPRSESSSMELQRMVCEYNECQNRDVLNSFFPEVAGWGKPGIQSSYTCSMIYALYTENANTNNDRAIVAIEDYFQCNYGSQEAIKSFKEFVDNSGVWRNSGIWRNPNVTLAESTLTYHGYPATKVLFIDNQNNNKIIGIYVVMILDPKLDVVIGIDNPDGKSISELDAQIEKFASSMDFQGLTQKVRTQPFITITPTTVETMVYNIIKPISLTARYNPDGTITVTNNGGTANADLSVIRVSVNGGKLRDKLDPQAGSSVTVQGIAGAKNRITAVGTFRNGTYAVVLDTNVGPNP